MKGVYGYETTTDMKAFVYGAHLHLDFVIPQATLTGTMYKGHMRIGQMFGSGTDITVQDLILSADETLAGQNHVDLTSALANDQILTHVLQGKVQIAEARVDPDLGSEVISY